MNTKKTFSFFQNSKFEKYTVYFLVILLKLNDIIQKKLFNMINLHSNHKIGNWYPDFITGAVSMLLTDMSILAPILFPRVPFWRSPS